MQAENLEQLGFSDLNEDESLIIVLFREWRRRTVPCAVAEDAIAQMLAADRIYPKMGKVFQVFSEMKPELSLAPGHDALLSQTEEALLTELARVFEDSEESISIRPAHGIARSNSDVVAARAQQSLWDCFAG